MGKARDIRKLIRIGFSHRSAVLDRLLAVAELRTIVISEEARLLGEARASGLSWRQIVADRPDEQWLPKALDTQVWTLGDGFPGMKPRAESCGDFGATKTSGKEVALGTRRLKALNEEKCAGGAPTSEMTFTTSKRQASVVEDFVTKEGTSEESAWSFDDHRDISASY